MYIIKLNAIDSTNSYLKEMAAVTQPRDYTVVVAEHQTLGRGQMGTFWESQSGKNLTMSVFKSFNDFQIKDQFYISIATALAICDVLKSIALPKLSIKWPNDILSANQKICGILIENVIKGNDFKGAIIGVGLNINQENFTSLPKATSLYNLTGKIYDKDALLSQLLESLQTYLKLLESRQFEELKQQYEALLFRINKVATFVLEDGNTITGIIKGVTRTGKLILLLADNEIRTYNLKALRLLY